MRYFAGLFVVHRLTSQSFAFTPRVTPCLRYGLLPLMLGLTGIAMGMGDSVAIAHQVKTADTVGATLHIEPNDNPQAGEASQVWFALTRQGGTVIPLADCDCQLQVYAQPFDPSADPLLAPPLVPTSAEGYQAIPSAEITFPTVGAYTLVLRGAPQADQPFSAFELAFDVTVAGGHSVPAAREPQAISSSPPQPSTETDPTGSSSPVTPSAPLSAIFQSQWQKPMVLGVLTLLMLGMGGLWRWRRSLKG